MTHPPFKVKLMLKYIKHEEECFIGFKTLISTGCKLKKSGAAKIFLTYFEVFGNWMTHNPLTIIFLEKFNSKLIKIN